MSNDIISTGNSVADNLLQKKLDDDLGLWALVSYFETKGLLDRAEFFKILNTEANLMVHAILKAEVEQGDQELI